MADVHPAPTKLHAQLMVELRRLHGGLCSPVDAIKGAPGRNAKGVRLRTDQQALWVNLHRAEPSLDSNRQ